MGYLSKEEILKTRERLRTEPVDVPEWGGEVLVRELTGEQRDAYQISGMVFDTEAGEMRPELSNSNAKLVALAIIDPDTGEPMFNSFEIGQLGQLSGQALTRVFEVAARLSGIGQQAVDEAKENLDATPTGDSSSS